MQASHLALKMERRNESSVKPAACTERARGRTRVLGAACRTGPWAAHSPTLQMQAELGVFLPSVRGEPAQWEVQNHPEQKWQTEQERGNLGQACECEAPACSHPPGTQSPQTAGRLRVREAPLRHRRCFHGEEGRPCPGHVPRPRMAGPRLPSPRTEGRRSRPLAALVSGRRPSL